MSTQLAPTGPNTLSPAEIARQHLSNDMMSEMMSEFDHVRDVVPFFSFNAKDGVFRDHSNESKNPEDHVKEMSGIILGVTYGQVWLAKEGETWSQKWICRANNKTKPPQVHPELSEQDRAIVAAKKAGVNCAICPLSRFQGDQKPVCNTKITLLMLRNDNSVILLSIKGTAFLAMDKFLGANFKRTRTPWFTYTLSLAREYKSQDGNSWWQIKPSLGPVTDVSTFNDLAALRSQYAAQVEAQEHHDDAGDAAEKTSTSDQPTASGAPVQASFELSDDGTPLWGAGADAPF